jgi:centrosomal protein POC5
MDQIAREMKASVEHEFVLAERAILTQQRSAMETQKIKADAAAYQQQSMIENLQDEKQKLSSRLELKQKQLKETMTLLQRARNGVVGRCIQERAICAWRVAARAHKENRIKSRLTRKVRDQHFMLVSFGAWRNQVQTAASSKLVAHERATAELVRTKLFEQMEAERTRTAAEVERLTRLLAEEAQQRQLLQENLKRVFMRGVCALNFEAMSLLADGTTDPSSQPAAPLLPQPPGFDWSRFEATSASGSAAQAGAGPPPAFDMAQPSPPMAADFTAAAATAAMGSSEVAVGVAAASVVEDAGQAGAPPQEIGDNPADIMSSRQPPVPSPPPVLPSASSQPPVQASSPLPFVNWSNPQQEAAVASTHAKAPLPRPVKSQRWQAAAAPRGPAPIAVP